MELATAVEFHFDRHDEGLGKCRFVSAGVEALTGWAGEAYSSGEVSLRAQFHPDDSDIVGEMFLQHGAARVWSARLIQRSGAVRCVRVEVVSVAQSVTLRVFDAVDLRAERPATPMDTNFVAMMEASDDYIYFKDRNHVFTGASQTLVSLTAPIEHWTDLIGKTDYDVFPREFADRYYKLEKDVFSGTIAVAQEIQPTLAKDGTRGWVDNRKYPIRNADGEIIGLFGIARDISKLVTAEELARQAQLSQVILEEVGDAVVMVDAHGRVGLSNRAARETFGLAVGTTLHDQVLVAALRAGTNAGPVDVMLGERIAVARVRPLVGLQGQGEGAILSLHDVTVARRAARELEAATRHAETASATKSRFLATMSHEIRTPMNAIIGLSTLGLDEREPDALRGYLRLIHSSGNNLLGIINDILDFSKMEAGKLHLDPQPFSLSGLLRDLSQMFEVMAEKKGIAFVCTQSSSVPDRVVGDALRVRQVLTNLLSNAEKFTEVGGVSLSVAASPSGPGVSLIDFVVTDTGIGMTDEQVARLFQPFSQADDTTTRRFGGTGLGLAISRELALLMRGALEVTSIEGTGTTFAFSIQLADAEPLRRELPAERDDRAVLKGLRVLLVEDNTINQMIAQALLKKAGAVVTLASDGSLALAELRHAPAAFDVVLMDLQMPVMDGFEATRRIRGELGLLALPIVALTAHAMREERERCLAQGMTAHVSKPINPRELYDLLNQWCDVRPS